MRVFGWERVCFESLRGSFESLQVFLIPYPAKGSFESLKGCFDSLRGSFESLRGSFESLKRCLESLIKGHGAEGKIFEKLMKISKAFDDTIH